MSQLRKSNDRIIAGVCGGIGEYLDIDPIIIRVAWCCLIAAQGFGILPYFLFALLMPSRNE